MGKQIGKACSVHVSASFVRGVGGALAFLMIFKKTLPSAQGIDESS